MAVSGLELQDATSKPRTLRPDFIVMLWKRLIAGPVMAGAALAVLYADASFAPNYPILFVLVMLALVACTLEFVHLIPADHRPRLPLCMLGVLGIASIPFVEHWTGQGSTSFDRITMAFTALAMIAFLAELYFYSSDGGSTSRLAGTLLAFVYLGLFGAFFVKLRWLNAETSGLMITGTIFVPKCGDIGAYFVGRFLGRTPFSPKISPKKTWEGFVGAVLGSVGISLVLNSLGPVFPGGWLEAVAFGAVLSVTGILGDLAESMLKRDGHLKDASASIPGFGGALDVVDSVLFSSPVAYLWFACRV